MLSNNDIDNILDFIEEDGFYFLVDEIKDIFLTYPLSIIDGDLVHQIIKEKVGE